MGSEWCKREGVAQLSLDLWAIARYASGESPSDPGRPYKPPELGSRQSTTPLPPLGPAITTSPGLTDMSSFLKCLPASSVRLTAPPCWPFMPGQLGATSRVSPPLRRYRPLRRLAC